MGRKIVYTPGERFGRLTVVRENGRTPHGQVMLDCVCDCGSEINVRGYSLRQGRTLSCGCYNVDRASEANTTHGHTVRREISPTYHTWVAMVNRCTRQSSEKWRDYGGRGIRICDRWLTFDGFLADMGERPEGKTLDRIDVDGDYTPENCRWATPAEQNMNQRRHKRREEEARSALEARFAGMVT